MTIDPELGVGVTIYENKNKSMEMPENRFLVKYYLTLELTGGALSRPYLVVENDVVPFSRIRERSTLGSFT